MRIPIADLSPKERYAWLQHAIVPRPIGLVSSINAAGITNLAPFSFFNIFSSEPPIVIFSPVRRMRNNTSKHILDNVQEVPEAVIHIVDYAIVQQTSLAACEYPDGVDEFIKAGFTKEAATIVRPPMIAESKIKLECKVNEVKTLGTHGGAGNLVIAEVVYLHVAESILNAAQTMIDQAKLEVVARMGGDYYCRTDLFVVPKPNTKISMGMDQLPFDVRLHPLLTSNHKALLAGVTSMPVKDPLFIDERLEGLLQWTRGENRKIKLYTYVKELLDSGDIAHAWQVLLHGYAVN